VDNHIDIDIGFDKGASLLSFSIRSEILPNVKTPEKEAWLQGTRAKIAKRAFGESAREGRSGLMKLAALVLQSDKTDITFGFVDDNHFQLNFKLAYVAASRAPSVRQKEGIDFNSY
jgi:hypothetical protein